MATAATTTEAPKGEAKAGEEDLSMEEILQSIKKIIADEDGDGKKSGDTPGGAADVPGSNILELTEMLKDDGTVVSLKPAEAPAKPAGDAPPADVLNTIDEALVPEKPAEKPAEKAAEKPPEKAPEKPVEKAADKPPEKATAAPAEKPAEKPAAAIAAAPPADSLLSSEAASAASDAFKKLKTAEPEPAAHVSTPTPVFRSGVTVEDMVADMLGPMMKTWLDANLPAIVERIVEKEVRKLTK